MLEKHYIVVKSAEEINGESYINYETFSDETTFPPDFNNIQQLYKIFPYLEKKYLHSQTSQQAARFMTAEEMLKENSIEFRHGVIPEEYRTELDEKSEPFTHKIQLKIWEKFWEKFDKAKEEAAAEKAKQK